MRWTKYVAKLFTDRDGQWRWQLISTANGKLVASSGEGYHNYHDCADTLHAIMSAMRWGRVSIERE